MSKRWWTYTVLTLVIFLTVFIKWSAQIEAPFKTETYETVKIIVLGLFMIVMAGVVVALMIWRKK